MDEQQKSDAYIIINSLIRVSDKLEPTHPGESVTMRQAAEWIERTCIPIAERRP